TVRGVRDEGDVVELDLRPLVDDLAVVLVDDLRLAGDRDEPDRERVQRAVTDQRQRLLALVGLRHPERRVQPVVLVAPFDGAADQAAGVVGQVERDALAALAQRLGERAALEHLKHPVAVQRGGGLVGDDTALDGAAVAVAVAQLDHLEEVWHFADAGHWSPPPAVARVGGRSASARRRAYSAARTRPAPSGNGSSPCTARISSIVIQDRSMFSVSAVCFWSSRRNDAGSNFAFPAGSSAVNASSIASISSRM